MSCRTCNEEPLHGAYLRWKSTNIEIIACREHWLEIKEVLMVAQRKEQRDLKLADLEKEEREKLILKGWTSREEDVWRHHKLAADHVYTRRGATYLQATWEATLACQMNTI